MNVSRERITKVDICIEEKPLSAVLNYLDETKKPGHEMDFFIEGDFVRLIATGVISKADEDEIKALFPGSKVEPSYMWLIE